MGIMRAYSTVAPSTVDILRTLQGTYIILAAVLSHFHYQTVVDILHIEHIATVDTDFKLLVGLHVVNVGNTRHLGRNTYSTLLDCKPCLEQYVVRLPVLIYFQQIITGKQRIHVTVGNHYTIVNIRHRSGT